MNGLYPITDIKLTPYIGIVEFVKETLRGGAKIVQLRDKDSDDIEIYPYALELKYICHIFGAKLIINDRVELAKKIGADGVHVGKEDLDIRKIKEGFKGIVGVSCYNDLDRAIKMERAGADYVAFGSFYSSSTKPDATKADPKILIEAKKALNIPICAIGGITIDNAKVLVENGADMVAVITDIWKAPNVEERAQKYKKLFLT